MAHETLVNEERGQLSAAVAVCDIRGLAACPGRQIGVVGVNSDAFADGTLPVISREPRQLGLKP